VRLVLRVAEEEEVKRRSLEEESKVQSEVERLRARNKNRRDGID